MQMNQEPRKAGITGDPKDFLIETRSPFGLLAPALVTLISMSHVPRAPFFLHPSSFSIETALVARTRSLLPSQFDLLCR